MHKIMNILFLCIKNEENGELENDTAETVQNILNILRICKKKKK